MKYDEKFRVKPGSRVRLDRIDAAFNDKHNRSHYEDVLVSRVHR